MARVERQGAPTPDGLAVAPDPVPELRGDGFAKKSARRVIGVSVGGHVPRVRTSLRIRSLGLLCVLAMTPACALRAQQLSDQPLTHERTLAANRQSDLKILLYPLIEQRGGEYGYIHPTSLIPVVNLFHIGRSHDFPETEGMLRSNQGGRATVTYGSLAPAFPYLLAEAMREMRLTSHATPIDQINAKVDLSGFDYVVMGKLRRTKLVAHANIVPLAVLGILGVPYLFANYAVEYDIELYRSGDMTNPIFTKSYEYRGSRVIGLYYNHSAYFDMFVEALEGTLPQAVEHLAERIAADPGASAAPVEPAAPAAPFDPDPPKSRVHRR